MVNFNTNTGQITEKSLRKKQVKYHVQNFF